MDSKGHWEAVYRAKRVDDVSWFQATPSMSLELIEGVAPSRAARIIDVGGGASTLVDGLLERGDSDVTVLDASDIALGNVPITITSIRFATKDTAIFRNLSLPLLRS